jgi:hypothetical protein
LGATEAPSLSPRLPLTIYGGRPGLDAPEMVDTAGIAPARASGSLCLTEPEVAVVS